MEFESIIPHRKDLNSTTTTTTISQSLPSVVSNGEIKMNPSVEEAEEESKFTALDFHSENGQLSWSKVSFGLGLDSLEGAM